MHSLLFRLCREPSFITSYSHRREMMPQTSYTIHHRIYPTHTYSISTPFHNACSYIGCIKVFWNITFESCPLHIRHYWLYNEVLERLDDVSTNHWQTTERSLVQDSNIQGRAVELFLWQILKRREKIAGMHIQGVSSLLLLTRYTPASMIVL